MSDSSPRRVIPIKVEPPSSLSAAERAAVLERVRASEDPAGGLVADSTRGAGGAGFRAARRGTPDRSRVKSIDRRSARGLELLSLFSQRARRPPRAFICVAPRRVRRSAQSSSKPMRSAAWALIFTVRRPTGRSAWSRYIVLGNCALGPAVMIDEQLQGRVTPQRFDALIAQSARSAQRGSDE